MKKQLYGAMAACACIAAQSYAESSAVDFIRQMINTTGSQTQTWTSGSSTQSDSSASTSTSTASDFGPGNSSEFTLSSGVKAYVVGVYGLTASKFTKRSDGFRAFSDSRIVDIEKHSGANAPDHQSCSEYVDLDCMVWAGWARQFGYADEDSFAEAYLYGSGEEDYDTIESMVEWEDDILYDKTFAQTLANRLAPADGLIYMDACFVNYNWYGTTYPRLYHAVLCCGYAYDTSKALTDPTCLKGLFIIDPDNDRETNGGGSAAPDTITYCPVTWNSSRGRYEIRGIFGATGYLPNEDESDMGFILRTADTPTRRRYVESQSSGSSSSYVNKMKGLYPKLRTEKSWYMKETDDGMVYVEGLATFKISSANKKGQVKFQVKLTPFFGTARSATKIVSPDSNGEISTEITIPTFGTFHIGLSHDMDYEDAYDGRYQRDNFFFYGAGTDNDLYFELRPDLGGKIGLDAFRIDFDERKLPVFNGKDCIEELLPLGYDFQIENGTTFKFNSRPKLGFIKSSSNRGYTVLKEFRSGYELVTAGNAAQDNYSKLKLKYAASSGVFQGTFAAYYTNGNYTSGKPKIYTAKVTVRGIVNGGSNWGAGIASMTIGGKSYRWPVSLYDPEYDDDDYDDGDDDDWDDDYGD